MLEEGVGFSEEWELGSLLSAARQRRAYRCKNGSTEGLIPIQIPSYSVAIKHDEDDEDSLSILLNIESQFNSGGNSTAGATDGDASSSRTQYVPTVSPSKLVVTEMMILAGRQTRSLLGVLCLFRSLPTRMRFVTVLFLQLCFFL